MTTPINTCPKHPGSPVAFMESTFETNDTPVCSGCRDEEEAALYLEFGGDLDADGNGEWNDYE